MKKYIRLMLVLALAFSVFGNVGSALASARTASWVVSVTYQNVGAAPTPVTVDFYAEGEANPITFNPLGVDGQGNPNEIDEGAGRSFFIGSVNGLDDGFRGNAVMMAEQPLVATVVQFSEDAGFKMRLLYNGFKAEDGSDKYLIATTVANTFSRTTIFSIQNIEGEQIDATVQFYNASGTPTGTPQTHRIPANSSKYVEVDVPADSGLPSSTFNGSAIVTAEKVSNGSSANVVAAVSELYTNSNVAANFEGVPLSRAANTVYLATALCERFGLDTFYAVQNSSTTPGQTASITVTYFNTNGSQKTTDGPYSIGPGQKKSINTCAPNSGVDMTNFTGSARVVSSGAPIVAIGKAQYSAGAGTPGTADVFTIFNGEAEGQLKLALPFVRWANDADYNAAGNTGGRQRSFLAIQNVGPGPAANVTVSYYGKDGDLVGTQQFTGASAISRFAKANSDANQANALGKNGMKTGSFGYYADGSFGGAVIITSDQPIIAIVRVQHPGAGEDYNGVLAP
jgi:hypothetical protein